MTPDQFKDIRLAAEMTQTELAEHFGVKLRTVQRWESGDVEINRLAEMAMKQLQAGDKKLAPKAATPKARKRKGKGA